MTSERIKKLNMLKKVTKKIKNVKKLPVLMLFTII